MAELAHGDWEEHLRQTLQSYDEALLRQVAHKLCRPRSHWPVSELIDRAAAALQNAVLLDRRLKELPDASRQALALMARSRQPRWPIGSLVEMLTCLGQGDGLAPLVTLLENGLLIPEMSRTTGTLKAFDTWLALTGSGTPIVMAPPLVLQRALNEEPGLPACPGAVEAPDAGATIYEADGLDWPLRLAVLWQQVTGAALRRTQQGEFFKRDFDRLRADPLLSTAPNDAPTPPPDPAFLSVALAAASGLLREEDGELRAGSFPPEWDGGLAGLLAGLWAALPWLRGWNAADGWQGASGPGNPYPSAGFLAVVLLTTLDRNAWADPAALDAWLAERHPYWHGRRGAAPGATAFLLGVAHPLRLLQARKSETGGWLVRLSPLGRWILGEGEKPPTLPTYPQTLLVQPNLEILAYRQGLTPELITRLSRLAVWKGLGPACTLQLEPQSVYRALEAGETLTSIVQLLERHGMKTVPAAVHDALRTWADKRERITVYAAAALFEFATAAELTEALSRGLPAVRLTDRLAVVANEKGVDYRHFRLTGTRDYLLPPERCIDVEPDGVTLNVDLARSDLLLETELARFAEPTSKTPPPGHKLYRLTPASLAAARRHGLSEAALEAWFPQRTGQPATPAARLLFAGPDAPAPELRRQLVLHVATAELADGLQQWPGTRSLIQARLGPTALAVAEEDVPVLTERLQELRLTPTDTGVNGVT